MTHKDFEKRYTLLILKQSPNIWNDPMWLMQYEDLIDAYYVSHMQNYTDPLQGARVFRTLISPYLLEPWQKELDTPIETRSTLTPKGIHDWIGGYR